MLFDRIQVMGSVVTWTNSSMLIRTDDAAAAYHLYICQPETGVLPVTGSANGVIFHAPDNCDSIITASLR